MYDIFPSFFKYDFRTLLCMEMGCTVRVKKTHTGVCSPQLGEVLYSLVMMFFFFRYLSVNPSVNTCSSVVYKCHSKLLILRSTFNCCRKDLTQCSRQPHSLYTAMGAIAYCCNTCRNDSIKHYDYICRSSG